MPRSAVLLLAFLACATPGCTFYQCACGMQSVVECAMSEEEAATAALLSTGEIGCVCNNTGQLCFKQAAR
jgi:hypothetical protein